MKNFQKTFALLYSETFFTVKKPDGQAIRSAEVKKSARILCIEGNKLISEIGKYLRFLPFKKGRNLSFG